MRSAFVFVLGLGLVTYAAAECANACSGHGVCRNSDQCDCFPNYNGADCSQRVCPYGLAWVDNPRGDLNHDGVRQFDDGAVVFPADNSLVPIYTYTEGPSAVTSATAVTVSSWETFNPDAQSNEGHYYTECSNKGLCDRATGLCVCYDGYTGSSCQRTTCPNDCSGHGVCRTVDEIAAGMTNYSTAAGSADFTSTWGGMNFRATDNYAGQAYFRGVTTSTLYRLWDQDMAQACVCDAGYAGPDCSRRECPRGDDPLTHRFTECPYNGDASWAVTQPCMDEVQKLTFDVTGAGADWFHILYRDWTGKIWRTDNFLVADDARTGGCTANADLPVSYEVVAIDPTTKSTYQANNIAWAVKNALESIPNSVIPSVTVAPSTVSSVNDGFAVDVTFTGNPGNVYPLILVNSIEMQGALPVCLSGDNVVDFTASVTTLTHGNKEQSTCSNRGVCDYDSGLCKCFKGYYGGDCSKQNALAQ
jgi:hypothetical protein